MLSAFPSLFDRAESALVERLGPVRRRSGTFPFTFTAYYTPEMGEGILRRFLSFERPATPESAADLKLWTNALEARLAGPEFPVPRPINLDPGYVTLSKLVLTTTKDQAHRIYLRDGIFAEITLSYTRGAWQPLPWTYADYRTEEYRAFFDLVRRDIAGASGPASSSSS